MSCVDANTRHSLQSCCDQNIDPEEISESVIHQSALPAGHQRHVQHNDHNYLSRRRLQIQCCLYRQNRLQSACVSLLRSRLSGRLDNVFGEFGASHCDPIHKNTGICQNVDFYFDCIYYLCMERPHLWRKSILRFIIHSTSG